MDQENEFLATQYIEYRKALSEIRAFAPFMPYGWFKSPQTIRLDTEFGLQQMIYRDLADDAARDLANGINHLIRDCTKFCALTCFLTSLESGLRT